MNLVQRISVVARMNAEAAKSSIEMERLILGVPDDDKDRPQGGKLNPTEAMEWLQAGMKTIEKFQRRQALRGVVNAKASGTAIVVVEPNESDAADDNDEELADVG
jgi:hypothetical protein